MAAKRRARKAKGRGGRNKRSIMADVFIWRDTGASEQEIRDKLKARGFKPPRVSELIKKTRPTYAATEETRLTNRMFCASQRSAKRRRLCNVDVLRDAGPQAVVAAMRSIPLSADVVKTCRLACSYLG